MNAVEYDNEANSKHREFNDIKTLYSSTLKTSVKAVVQMFNMLLRADIIYLQVS